jgi:hypothetical protein
MIATRRLQEDEFKACFAEPMTNVTAIASTVALRERRMYLLTIAWMATDDDTPFLWASRHRRRGSAAIPRGISNDNHAAAFAR